MSVDEIGRMRSFNRTVTERIGALDDQYLSRGRPLGASRLLWEIGAAGSDLRQLRNRLALDSGYLSRLLRTLESDGLVTVGPLDSDRRVRIARRTPAGDAEVAELDRLSDELARRLLEPLSERQRGQLLTAAATVERLLTAGMVDIAPADAASDGVRICVESYYAELDRRMDGGFDAALSRYGDIADFVEPAGMVLLARLRDEPVGCGALRFGDGDAIEIKRMWLAGSVRGLGLGRRLLGELERQARERGATVVRLDTNHVLTEAIAMYRRSGYVEVPPFNDEHHADHWFEGACLSVGGVFARRSGSVVPGRVVPVVSADARILLQTRGLRAFGDGMVSVVLAVLLTALGMSEVQIGAIVTATLLGSAITTLAVGLKGHRIPRRTLLMAATMLMAATGVGFAVLDTFWGLLVVGLVGTLNPSGGDVSLFLPTEQALLPGTMPDARRTELFARYALVGSLVAAFGSLCAGLPEWLARRYDIDHTNALRVPFVIYAALAGVIALRYRRLSPEIEPASREPVALHASRWIVYRLAVLFSVDSFGGGFVITALLVVWLQNRFGLSLAVSGTIFFWAGLLSAFSALVAARIAGRIGLVRTMVYTHLPANALLIATAFMPKVWLAVGCLLLRSALSQMDVPARTSYVMAVVTPAERPAAASVTNVPRSLASAVPPILAGWMLARTTFGWPLVIGGTIKATYDLLLLAQFRELRPPEEVVSPAPAP